MMGKPDKHRLSIRIDLAGGGRIGPGKVALLEEIGRSGSISAAGRAMKMSYRRAWQLVEDLNGSLASPVVETATGGAGGGGARLTEAGRTLVQEYRALEVAASRTAGAHLTVLDRIVGPPTG
jgi:molybdate transport system regulatory protein